MILSDILCDKRRIYDHRTSVIVAIELNSKITKVKDKTETKSFRLFILQKLHILKCYPTNAP